MTLPMKLHNWVDVTKINWSWLSGNPNAIELLKENPEKIHWAELSSNQNANELLKENLDKIYCVELSQNQNAIELLKENPDKIHWYYLSFNPSIFTYDYSKMIERPFVEELMAKLYHPDKLEYYLDKYNYDIGEDDYL